MKTNTGGKILIVDDEPDICFLLSKIIATRNLDTGYAHSLAAASSAITANNPSVIFLDNSLPDGKGIEFIPFIKATCPSARVVMVTANDSVDERKAAIGQGADIFLGKPITRELINATLDSLLSKV